VREGDHLHNVGDVLLYRAPEQKSKRLRYLWAAALSVDRWVWGRIITSVQSSHQRSIGKATAYSAVRGTLSWLLLLSSVQWAAATVVL